MASRQRPTQPLQCLDVVTILQQIGCKRMEKGAGCRAVMLADVLAGGSPAGGACSVATVVISGGGEGDRSVDRNLAETVSGRPSRRAVILSEAVEGRESKVEKGDTAKMCATTCTEFGGKNLYATRLSLPCRTSRAAAGMP